MIDITRQKFNILVKANEIIHGLGNITDIKDDKFTKIKNIYDSINNLLFDDLNVIASKNDRVHNVTIPLKFAEDDTIYTIKQVKVKNICPICKGTGIIKYKNKDIKCPECMGKGELISGKQISIVVDEPFKIKSVKINMGDNHIKSIQYRGTCGLNEFNRAEGNLFFTKEEAQQRCDELNKERMTIDIKDIDIPKDFRNSKPSIDKIKRKLDYYKNNNKFDKDIIIDRDRVLQDGYITYLLCKMFNVNNIDVIVQDIKSNIKNDTVPTTPKKKRPRPGFY